MPDQAPWDAERFRAAIHGKTPECICELVDVSQPVASRWLAGVLPRAEVQRIVVAVMTGGER